MTRSGPGLRCDKVAARWRYLSDLLRWIEPDFWDCFCENAFAWDSSTWSSESRPCCPDGSDSRTEQYVVNRFTCKQQEHLTAKEILTVKTAMIFIFSKLTKSIKHTATKQIQKLKIYILHSENRSLLLSVKYIHWYPAIISFQKV